MVTTVQRVAHAALWRCCSSRVTRTSICASSVTLPAWMSSVFPPLEEGVSTSVHSLLSMRNEEVLWLVHRSASRHVVGQSGQDSPSSNPLLAFILVHWGRGERHSLLLLRRRSRDGVSTSPQIAKLVVMMYVNCEMWCFLRQLSEVSSSSKSS